MQANLMTSREIAAIICKPHGEVMADIQQMMYDLNQDPRAFEGQGQHGFDLPHRETLVLATGYGPSLGRRVAEAVLALEALPAPAASLDFAGKLRLAAERQEVIERHAVQ